MSSPGSVTDGLARLPQGDQEAVRNLWQRYYPRLVGLALQQLRGAPARQADAEDVALSAFAGFCRGAERGRFPDLGDLSAFAGFCRGAERGRFPDLGDR